MEQPNYYAIIPANVRYDNELSDKAKLLYGEITSLCDKEGYCWATNEYFSKLYQTSEKTITRNLKQLEDKMYINLFYQTIGAIKKRYITTDKNVLERTKMSLDEGQKCPINNTSNNIKEINNNKLLFTKKSFEKPTLKEVQTYCLERNNNIDAEKFIDYYESNGWKVGRNSMKDWKACIRTWEKNKQEKHDVIKSYKTNFERSQEALRKAREEFESEQKGSH